MLNICSGFYIVKLSTKVYYVHNHAPNCRRSQTIISPQTDVNADEDTNIFDCWPTRTVYVNADENIPLLSLPVNIECLPKIKCILM